MSLQNVLEAFGLRHRARESIKNKAMPAMQTQPILDQLDDDFVGHESTVLRCLGRFQSERRAEFFLAPQDRSRRRNWNSEMAGNHLGLCSFSGTRCAEEDETPFH